MKVNRKLAIAIGVTVVSTLLVAWGYHWISSTTKRHFAHDATLMLSGSIAGAKDEAERANWQQTALGLNQASVMAPPDKQGRPCDPWGIPYRAAWKREQGLWIATVTSAGPDQAFDTPDDISNTAVQSP